MKRIKPYLENKYLLSNVDKNVFLESFKNLLRPDENGSNGHYFVSSIYFDTDTYDFYHDKLEGEYFKIKIRIRRYSFDKNLWSSPKLELKMKRGERTSKITKEITDKDVERLISTPLSGYEILRMLDWDNKIPMDFLSKRVFKPITEIIYDRDAFYFSIIPDFRITFDYRICMKSLDLPLKQRIDDLTAKTITNQTSKYLSEINNIFELKTYIQIPELFLEWLQSRNITQEHISKYSLSVEKSHKF